MDKLAEVQIRFNAASREEWESYRGHRRVITELLTSAPCGRGGRLGILGAGNCNDLDLGSLLAFYQEVHLFDLDAEALAHGVGRQNASGHAALHLRGGVDVTG